MPAPIEFSKQYIQKADMEMHEMLDKWEQLSQKTRKRLPLKIEDYSWNTARPDRVRPTIIAALQFVSHVERPPHLYSQPILQAARDAGVTSLERFIERTWLPEETNHGLLLRKAAIVYGAVPQEQHDRDLARIDKLNFPIGRGYTAGKAATYGEGQELITDLFYIAMRNNTYDPNLRSVLSDLAAQEMFHSRVYREFRMRFATPEDTVEAIAGFKMPGHITSPKLQQYSTGWAHELGFDFKRMRHSLATMLIEQSGYQGLGRVVTSEIIRNDYPTPIRTALSLANRINNPVINSLSGRVAARVSGVKLKAV